MKRKVLSVLLVAMMVVNLLPIATFAAVVDLDTPVSDMVAGDTFYADSSSATLPNAPEYLEWTGPADNLICTETQHTHKTSGYQSCYDTRSPICGITAHSHRTDECYTLTCTRNESYWPGGHRHSVNNGCYTLTCTTEAHEHSANNNCYPLTCGLDAHAHSEASGCYSYTWTLLPEGTDRQYRTWWPFYWDFEERSSIKDDSVVSVEAGNADVLHSSGSVDPDVSLSADTADVGDALDGVVITVDPGYYVTQYRIVCGNHDGCGVTSYSESVHTSNHEGNYTATVEFTPDTDEFDHWSAIHGITGDPSEDNGYNAPHYIPVLKSDVSANNTYAYPDNSNVIYPFYLLMEVKQDTHTYSVTYEWGELAEELEAYALPEGEDLLLHNESHEAQDPGEGEAKAIELGYKFNGWKVIGDGYSSNAMVQPGNNVVIYGSDLRLVAQWLKEAQVTYSYEGDIPSSADALPDSSTHTEGSTVRVAATPDEVSGYSFSGWETDDVSVSGSSFTMPNTPVHFVGTWSVDHTQTQKLAYTVEYYFNHVKDSSMTQRFEKTVWVNDTTLPVDQSQFHEVDSALWKLSNTDPSPIPAVVAGGTVIKLYYTGTHTDVDISKTVDKSMAAVGDEIIYTIVVENTGTADLTNVEILDTPNGAGNITLIPTTGVSYEGRTTDDLGQSVDRFVIAALDAGATTTIKYSYIVHSLDAGKTLTNTAHWHNEDGSMTADSAMVEVLDQYTLTVKHYADNVLQSALTKTYALNENASWRVTINGTGGTYNAPKTITAGGTEYAFDDPATTDILSGTMTSDVTVELYYSLDELEPDKPQDLPDKYEVQILYQAGSNADITGRTSEVLTLRDAQDNLVTKGDVTASGTTSKPSTEGYELDKWLLGKQGTGGYDITDQLTGDKTSFSNYLIHNADGGSTYVFTVHYKEPLIPGIRVEKFLNSGRSAAEAEIGQVLHYTIHVHNTGNVDLSDITVTDEMVAELDGEKTDLTGQITVASNPYVTYNPETGVFTIAASSNTEPYNTLSVGGVVSIYYTYTVQEADAGKTIKNVIVDTNVTTTDELPGTEIKVEDPMPGINIVKTLSSGQKTTVAVGDTISWTIDVYNVGNVKLENITLADTLENAAGKANVYATGASDTPLDLSSYTFDLAVEGHKTFIATYVVQAQDTGKTINNSVVAASGNTTDDDTANDPVYVKKQFAVTYKYVGTVPENAPAAPVDEVKYNEGDTVIIKGKPSLDGYDFFGWTHDEINTASGSFAINQDVELHGHFLSHADIDAVKTAYAINGDTRKTSGASEGDIIEWKIVVTNDGQLAGDFSIGEHLTDAVIYDKPMAEENRTLIHKDDVFTLEPGQSITLYAQYQVKNSDAGAIINKVHLSTQEDEIPSEPVPVINLSVLNKQITAINGTAVASVNELKVGDTVQWTIKVKNTGDADGVLTQDALTDQLLLADGTDYTPFTDQSVTFKTAFPVTVKAGTTVDVLVEWTVPESAFGKKIANSAKVGEDDPFITPEIPVEERNPELTVEKTLSDHQAASVKVGETISWNIIVKNTGNVKLENITLTDTLQYSDGTAVDDTAVLTPAETTFALDAGQEKTFNAKYVVQEADAGKYISNVAIAESDEAKDSDNPNDPVYVKDLFTVTYLYDPALPADPEAVFPEKPVTVIYNEGDVVTVDTETAANAPEGYDFSNWFTEDATVGADGTFTIAKDVTFTGTFLSHADITAVKQVSKIKDTSFTAGMMAEYGDVITWTITVMNSGSLPGEFYLQELLADAVIFDAAGNTITPADKQTVAGHKSLVYTAVYTVKATDADKIVNTISVNGINTPSDEDVPVKVRKPSIVLDKTVNRTFAYVGDTVTYQITVTNNGEVQLKDLIITDTFSGSIADIALGTLSDGVVYQGNGVFKLDTLDVGTSAQIEFSYRIFRAEDWLKNTAVVTATPNGGVDPSPVTAQDSAPDVDVRHKITPKPSSKPNLNKEDHRSYIIGYPDGTVRPNGTITRAEVATIFFRLLTDESREHYWSQTNPFSDVPADAWFNNAVSTMYNAGIINGYPDGTFRPSAPVSRAEFTAIATRFHEQGRDGVSQSFFKQYFKDVNQNNWYAAAVELAYELGWAQGYEGNFRPTDNMSRAEVVTMVNRILERDVQEKHLLDDMIHWPDNTPDKWYYEAVQEASNSHEYYRTDKKVPLLDFKYEIWTKILENPDWAALERQWSEANSQH